MSHCILLEAAPKAALLSTACLLVLCSHQATHHEHVISVRDTVPVHAKLTAKLLTTCSNMYSSSGQQSKILNATKDLRAVAIVSCEQCYMPAMATTIAQTWVRRCITLV